jgi:hypothetical protein
VAPGGDANGAQMPHQLRNAVSVSDVAQARNESPAREIRAGLLRFGSLAVLLAAAGPDQVKVSPSSTRLA